ncbi:MAG: glutamate 5-kinase [Pseudomonadota bacterium]
MDGTRAWQSECTTWVVKVGSALLTENGKSINDDLIDALAEELCYLRARDCRVLLVTSGAVAAGLLRLNESERPTQVHELQAAAAIGQSVLMRRYEEAFARRQLLTAQILLGHDDIAARDRYLNARGALQTLLARGVVPIINENDTVATDEIRFGDNDTLAALVANLVDADVLVLLTDQSGLYDADPRSNAQASLLTRIEATHPSLDKVAGAGGALGRGGMVTKVRAARLAARSGTETLILSGLESRPLQRLVEGEELGTWLESHREPQAARRQWLAGLVTYQGVLELDAGAVTVIRESGKSLLPVGVTAVQGNFARGDIVLCKDPDGLEVARGLVNYSSDESRRILRKSSQEIASALGYKGEDELIHRDNMVIL